MFLTVRTSVENVGTRKKLHVGSPRGGRDSTGQIEIKKKKTAEVGKEI